MLTQEDLQNIKDLFEDQNHHIESIERKIDSGFHRLDSRMDGLEQRMDGIEQRQDSMENYMHDKFAVIENDLIPKVNALYEATDLYVKGMECRKQIAEIENKLDYVEPLVKVVQSHGEKLEQHETTIKKLVETA